MLISTRGRYALRVLAEMERMGGDSFLPLREISRRQGISEKYLESIMLILVKSGIVEGSRGRAGGYRFKRAPGSVTVWEVLEATEGSLAPVSCQKTDADPCERANECCCVPLWQGLEDVISAYLSRYTICDLAAEGGLL